MTQYRGKRLFLKSSLLALGLFQSIPATAQDTPKDDKAKEPKLVIELKALTETVEGLRSKPSDTVGTNGGDMEAAILSAFAIRAAAKAISEDIIGNGPIVVVGYEDAIAADIYAIYQAEYGQICQQLTGNPKCDKPEVKPSGNRPPKEGGALLPVLGALLPFVSSLLRSETEISKLDGGLNDDRLLAYAVAKKYGTTAVVLVPPSLTSIAPNDPTVTELQKLKTAHDEVQKALPKKNPDAKKVAAVAAADTLQKALLTADDKGSVKLITVIRARLVASARDNRTLVRVNIEKSGGTLLKRKSLFVALGAPAVAVTGGLIATYVIDSGNGYSKGQGMVACQTRLANLRTVHRLKETSTPECRVF